MTASILYATPILVGIAILCMSFRTETPEKKPVKRHLYLVDCRIKSPNGNETISVAVVATDEWYAHFGARCNVSRRNYVFIDSENIRRVA
jgi:hypothetical protein